MTQPQQPETPASAASSQHAPADPSPNDPPVSPPHPDHSPAPGTASAEGQATEQSAPEGRPAPERPVPEEALPKAALPEVAVSEEALPDAAVAAEAPPDPVATDGALPGEVVSGRAATEGTAAVEAIAGGTVAEDAVAEEAVAEVSAPGEPSPPTASRRDWTPGPPEAPRADRSARRTPAGKPSAAPPRSTSRLTRTRAGAPRSDGGPKRFPLAEHRTPRAPGGQDAREGAERQEAPTVPEVLKASGALAVPEASEVPEALTVSEAPAVQRAGGWSAAAAFDALYSRHAAALTRQAMALSGHRRPAERAVRRAFRRAWQHWPEVAVDSDPVGWVRAAVHEAALSPWQRRHPLAHDSLWEPRSTPLAPPRHRSAKAAGAPTDPAQRALFDALLSLPVPYRRALLLHDGLGLGLPTTAAESEASPAATAGRLARARQLVACELPSLGLARRSPEERGRMLRDGLAEALAALPVAPRPARKVRRGGEYRARLLVPGVLTVSALFTATAAWTGTTTLEHLLRPTRPAAAPGPADVTGGPQGAAGPGPGDFGLTGPQHPGFTQVGAGPTPATASAADPSTGSGATASGSPGDASATAPTAVGTGGPTVGGAPHTGLPTATSGQVPANRSRSSRGPRHRHSPASSDRPGATTSAGTAGPGTHRSHPAASAGGAGSWEGPSGSAAVQGGEAGEEPFTYRHGRWATPFGSAASAPAPHRSRQTPASGSTGSHHGRRPQPYASGGHPSSHHRSRLGGLPTATGRASTTGSPGTAAHHPTATVPAGGSSRPGSPAGGLREAPAPGTTVSEDGDTPAP